MDAQTFSVYRDELDVLVDRLQLKILGVLVLVGFVLEIRVRGIVFLGVRKGVGLGRWESGARAIWKRFFA